MHTAFLTFFQKTRYMRGRLTLEKVNAAINDMASYAEANAHLIAASKQKVYLPAEGIELYRLQLY